MFGVKCRKHFIDGDKTSGTNDIGVVLFKLVGSIEINTSCFDQKNLL